MTGNWRGFVIHVEGRGYLAEHSPWTGLNRYRADEAAAVRFPSIGLACRMLLQIPCSDTIGGEEVTIRRLTERTILVAEEISA